MKLHSVIAGVTLLTAACGPSNNDNTTPPVTFDTTGNNTAVNNTTSNNTAANNTTANNTTANNTTANNTTANNTNNGEMGDGMFTLSMVVNGQTLNRTCVEDAEVGAPDELGVYADSLGFAVISCPPDLDGLPDNNGVLLALGVYEELTPEFSFTEADVEVAWDVTGYVHPEDARINSENVTTATLSGTWDAATRRLTGTISATFEETADLHSGSLDGSFDVTVPEP